MLSSLIISKWNMIILTSLLSILSVLQNYHERTIQEYRFVDVLYNISLSDNLVNSRTYYFVSFKLVCSVTSFKIEVGDK